MLFLFSIFLMAALLLALSAVAIGSQAPGSSTELSLYAAAGLSLLFGVAIIIYNGGVQ
ncbi:hypothetical protein [Corynebacterium guaraldiae]|uniref:hypothetical protein n=1 Tax=Corynebacterium guaraldiae TaxID=3051103 RepID=UPI00163DC757|nr:hypothetical protein [Corynebacterium guaraldiae]